MYFNAKKYIEFQGKDDAYITSCLAYCAKRGNHSRRFLLALAILLSFTISIPFWFDLRTFTSSDLANSIIVGVAIGVLFVSYLVIEINTALHKSVKQYIEEFEITYSK